MLWNQSNTKSYASKLFQGRPAAVAQIQGSSQYPALHGTVSFYPALRGTLVAAEFFGLPASGNPCQSPVLGFHIHEGGSCTGDESDPFKDAGMHYNPKGCPHPFHAGDLPPLFSNNGYAWMCVLTNRARVKELVGRTVIIHSAPDDFTTQPSGNSGEKIACGVIQPV